jgi:hypothetical protein
MNYWVLMRSFCKNQLIRAKIGFQCLHRINWEYWSHVNIGIIIYIHKHIIFLSYKSSMNFRKWCELRRNYPPDESSHIHFLLRLWYDGTCHRKFAAVSRTTSRIGDGIKWRIKQRLKSHAEATAALVTHNHARTLRRPHWDPNVNQIKFLNLDMHLNVLFIEYVAWLCVTSAGCKRRYSMWFQQPSHNHTFLNPIPCPRCPT